MGTKLRKPISPTKALPASLYAGVDPDPFDSRDLPARLEPLGWTPPQHVDYGPQCGPVGDQGRTPSCVGWSAAALMRWLHGKATRGGQSFSVRFLWTLSNAVEEFRVAADRGDLPRFDAGWERGRTYLRDVMKVLNWVGACANALWPWERKAPPETLTDLIRAAMVFRVQSYRALRSNQERLDHLQNDGPFLLSIPIYENWSDIDASGVAPLPAGRRVGGHAVLVVGFVDEKFKFMNSHGTDWGDRGFGYLTQEFMEKHSWNSWGARYRRWPMGLVAWGDR